MARSPQYLRRLITYFGPNLDLAAALIHQHKKGSFKSIGCADLGCEMLQVSTRRIGICLSLASVNHHKGLLLESRKVQLEVVTAKVYRFVSSVFT
ncbi:hypothetical protein EJB05_02252, partial [Eragrostis curvula]